jgi:prevent-host-death family protein
MKKNIWQIQSAKNRLSEVINNAVKGEPQMITKHGEPVAYLISVQTYNKKISGEKLKKKILLTRPHREIKLNLPRDNDPGRDVKL